MATSSSGTPSAVTSTPPVRRMPLLDPRIRRVALVRLRLGLGDLLCSAPALRELKAHRPDLWVAMVSWPEVAPVVERLGYVDELLPFPGHESVPDRPPGAGPFTGRSWEERWRAFTQTAADRRFDLALQAYGDNPAANAVTSALGAHRVGGFAPTGWQPHRDVALHLPYPVGEHEVRRHLLLLARLGMPLHSASARMELPVTAEETAEHRARLQRLRLEPQRYAVLHPGASSPSRRWPVESYAELVDRLAAEGLSVVVTGSTSERDLVGRLCSAVTVPVVNLGGDTDLAALALLLRDAAVLVGNDTGTAHLAAAVGGRSVTIFQPGDPVRWAHTGPTSRPLTPDVACAPCAHLECPIDFRCARATNVDRVMGAARDLLPAAAVR